MSNVLHQFPGRTPQSLVWQAKRRPSIFKDSSDSDSDSQGSNQPSRNLKKTRPPSKSPDSTQVSGPSRRRTGPPMQNPSTEHTPKVSEKEKRLMMDWASRVESTSGHPPHGLKTWTLFADKVRERPDDPIVDYRLMCICQYHLPGSADFYAQAYQRLRQSNLKSPIVETPTSLLPKKRPRASDASSDIGSEPASKRIKSQSNQHPSTLPSSSKTRDGIRNPAQQGSSSSALGIHRPAVDVSSDDFEILVGHVMRSKPSPDLHGDIAESLLTLSSSEVRQLFLNSCV